MDGVLPAGHEWSPSSAWCQARPEGLLPVLPPNTNLGVGEHSPDPSEFSVKAMSPEMGARESLLTDSSRLKLRLVSD